MQGRTFSVLCHRTDQIAIAFDLSRTNTSQCHCSFISHCCINVNTLYSFFLAPNLKALAPLQEWEEKLLLIQDILDAMLKCQITWLYLEPIFSSEDIIAQMPEEGRKFGIVDCYWKDIIAEAVRVVPILIICDL